MAPQEHPGCLRLAGRWLGRAWPWEILPFALAFHQLPQPGSPIHPLAPVLGHSRCCIAGARGQGGEGVAAAQFLTHKRAKLFLSGVAPCPIITYSFALSGISRRVGVLSRRLWRPTDTPYTHRGRLSADHKSLPGTGLCDGKGITAARLSPASGTVSHPSLMPGVPLGGLLECFNFLLTLVLFPGNHRLPVTSQIPRWFSQVAVAYPFCLWRHILCPIQAAPGPLGLPDWSPCLLLQNSWSPSFIYLHHRSPDLYHPQPIVTVVFLCRDSSLQSANGRHTGVGVSPNPYGAASPFCTLENLT